MLADLQEENERAAAGEIRQAAQRPWRALPPDILRTTSELNKSTSLLFLFRPPPQSHRTITKLIFCIKKGIERAINSNILMIKADNKYKRCFLYQKEAAAEKSSVTAFNRVFIIFLQIWAQVRRCLLTVHHSAQYSLHYIYSESFLFYPHHCVCSAFR